METELYTVDEQAVSWFTGLDPAEREALDAAIDRLLDLPEKDWPANGAIWLNLSEPTFLLKLGPSLRALIRPTSAGKPEVLDFTHQSTIDLLRSQGHWNVHFTVHNRASLGISSLTTAEREALEAAMAPLVDRLQEDWEKYGAIRLGLPEPTFMLKFNQRWRAIIRPTAGGQPELLDLVSHETLQYFREAEAARKKSVPRRATSTS